MDILVRRSSLLVRAALAVISTVTAGLALLALVSGVMMFLFYFEPPPLPVSEGGFHVLDGPTRYGFPPPLELAAEIFAWLLYLMLLVSAIGVWWRFRRFATVLAGFYLILALLWINEGSACAEAMGLGWCYPTFRSVFGDAAIVLFPIGVGLLLRHIDRGPAAAATVPPGAAAAPSG